MKFKRGNTKTIEYITGDSCKSCIFCKIESGFCLNWFKSCKLTGHYRETDLEDIFKLC